MDGFSWGSPVGLGVFLAGLGMFFWGIYNLSLSDRINNKKD